MEKFQESPAHLSQLKSKEQMTEAMELLGDAGHHKG